MHTSFIFQLFPESPCVPSGSFSHWLFMNHCELLYHFLECLLCDECPLVLPQILYSVLICPIDYLLGFFFLSFSWQIVEKEKIFFFHGLKIVSSASLSVVKWLVFYVMCGFRSNSKVTLKMLLFFLVNLIVWWISRIILCLSYFLLVMPALIAAV